jgi:hypothetical protein
MRFAPRVITYLESRRVPCALIGGVALSVHGIARATLDVDLLVADPAILKRAFWAAGGALGTPEIRRGDADDPLAGIVRFARRREPVDVLVGRGLWTRKILTRRQHLQIGRTSLPVVDRADLVLLKLFAGGPQDLLDVELLLAADAGDLAEAVQKRVREAPPAAQRRWKHTRPR